MGRRFRCLAWQQGLQNVAFSFLLPSQHSCQPGTKPFPRKPRRKAKCWLTCQTWGCCSQSASVPVQEDWQSSSMGAASKNQDVFPECFRFQRLNRFRWAYPLLLLLHPSALKISERDCLLHIYIWVADRILRELPRFYALTPTMVLSPHRVSKTENMMDLLP